VLVHATFGENMNPAVLACTISGGSGKRIAAVGSIRVGMRRAGERICYI